MTIATRLLAIAALLGLSSLGCVYARVVYFNYPSLSASTYFASRPVRASRLPIALKRAESEVTFALADSERARYAAFDQLLESNDTRAFIALRDDRVVYERYFHGVNATTQLADFSMSKTFAALMICCAVSDGLLPSVHEKLPDLLPELASRSGYRDMTVEHLLRMTSGLDFDEESTSAAMLYYETDLRRRMYSYDVKWAPGTHYLYGSISTQILWDVLHRQLAGRTVAEYFEERIWSRLGAQSPASWSLDSAASGIEKLFGGFNATAEDHARLGLLFLHGGTFEGRMVVPQSWVDESLSPDLVAGTVHTADGFVRRGKYQWFLTLDGRGQFVKGYHGQYVFVVPEKKLVFVRFGEGYGDVDWVALFMRLADESP